MSQTLLGGSRSLRPFLQDPVASKLNLSRKIRTATDIQQLEQYLLSNKSLTELAICELGPIDIDLSVLRKLSALLASNSTSVTKLDLSGISTDKSKCFGAEGAIILAECLEKNTTLTELNLSGNLIGAEGVRAIFKALENNLTLFSLDISANEIDLDGIKYIAQALHNNSSLSSLNITANHLNSDGARIMKSISMESNALIKFDLDKLSQSDAAKVEKQNVIKEQLFSYSSKKLAPEVYAGYCQSVFMKDTITQFSFQEQLLRCVTSKEELSIANMFTRENARAEGLIGDVNALLLFAWFEGGFNEERFPTSVLLYKPGSLAVKLLMQNMSRPYIIITPSDFHPDNKGLNPKTLFNYAKTLYEKESIQITMLVEDVEKMFLQYDNPKQQKNIRDFMHLVQEFVVDPGTILILATSNINLDAAKEKKFSRQVWPKISSPFLINYMLLLLLQSYEHNLSAKDIQKLAERLAGCRTEVVGDRRSGVQGRDLAPADIEKLLSDAFIISKAKDTHVMTIEDIDLALRDSGQFIIEGAPVKHEPKVLTKLELENQLKLFQSKILKEKNIFVTFDILTLGLTSVKLDQILHFEFMKKLKKMNMNSNTNAASMPCLNLVIVEQYWRVDVVCQVSRMQFASSTNKFITAQSLSLLKWNNLETKLAQYEQENAALKHQLNSLLHNVVRNVVNSQAGIPFEQITIDKKMPLGHGSFSQVYKGKWLGQNVALKKMKDGGDMSNITVFAEEAEALTRLRHKHIVVSYGVSIDPNTADVVLVMEYLKDGSLEDLIKKKATLTTHEAMHIALDVAKGLMYLHSRSPKFIHRDIKTGNVLLYNGKRAKIADFGTAKELEKKTVNIVGTFNYMAPEILKQEPYDEKCDIYSFGVVLFEMLTGEPLLPSSNEDKRIKKANEKIKESRIRQLILDCCKQDPKKRPIAKQIIEQIKIIRKELNNVTNSTQ